MLASAAAHRGLLDEAFGHIRQIPAPTDGGRCPLSSATVVQVLSMAAQEQQLPAAAAELQRVHARMEAKQFEELLVTASKRTGGFTACRDLIEVGTSLKVPKKPSVYQTL